MPIVLLPLSRCRARRTNQGRRGRGAAHGEHVHAARDERVRGRAEQHARDRAAEVRQRRVRQVLLLEAVHLHAVGEARDSGRVLNILEAP